jgi:hypothetical protein
LASEFEFEWLGKDELGDEVTLKRYSTYCTGTKGNRGNFLQQKKRKETFLVCPWFDILFSIHYDI